MTFACLLVFVSSFSRIWPESKYLLSCKSEQPCISFAYFRALLGGRAAREFFSQQTSRIPTRSDVEGLEISALHLEKTLARHLGYRHSDDRNADHNERLHHVGDRSHFGTRRTSSSFGSSRSSLTHLRRRERVPTVDTPPLKDNNRVWLMLAAGRSYSSQRAAPVISNLLSTRSRSLVSSSALRDV